MVSMIICFYFFLFFFTAARCHLEAVAPSLLVSLSPMVQVYSSVVLPQCPSWNSREALYSRHPWTFSKLSRVCSRFTVSPEKELTFKRMVGRDTARGPFQHKLSRDSAIKILLERDRVAPCTDLLNLAFHLRSHILLLLRAVTCTDPSFAVLAVSSHTCSVLELEGINQASTE